MEPEQKQHIDTLPETNVAMENPQFYWYLPGKMGIFMGYVSFREGTGPQRTDIPKGKVLFQAPMVF